MAMIPPGQEEFETLYRLTQIDSRTEARCTACGAESLLFPAAQLRAIKTRHPRNRNGRWLILCPEHWASHTPAAPPAPTPLAATKARGTSKPPAAPPPPPAPTAPRVLTCPSCFLVVPSATRHCDDCDITVTS